MHKAELRLVQGDAIQFLWSKPRQALNARETTLTRGHSSQRSLCERKNRVRGTSQQLRGAQVPGLAQQAADAPGAVTMLPRLDFHSSLRDAVLAGRKTATTRLVGELESIGFWSDKAACA